MEEQERDYFREQIRRLERSNRRWKLATLSLAGALAILVIMGGVSSFLFGIGRVQERRLMREMERARADEAAARVQAEQAARQVHELERDTKEIKQKRAN